MARLQVSVKQRRFLGAIDPRTKAIKAKRKAGKGSNG